MTLNLFSKVFPLVVFAFALPANAGLILSSGAGPLPAAAENLVGLYPSEIIGNIPDTPDPLLGVNMFQIFITSPAAFSAVTIGSAFGIPDTELFLFDSQGNGVYANDDISGGNTLSCLPSAGGGNPCASSRPPGIGPMSAGIYYLAITRSANLPLSGTNDIFNIVNFTDVAGPVLSGNSPIDGWDGGAFTSPDTDLVKYDIVLTGTVPEPATWTMIGTVGLLLALCRRKLAA